MFPVRSSRMYLVTAAWPGHHWEIVLFGSLGFPWNFMHDVFVGVNAVLVKVGLSM